MTRECVRFARSIIYREISIDMNRECVRFARSIICSHSSRFMRGLSRILRKFYNLKFIVYSRYPGNLIFAAVRVFNENTRMGTIKNKMVEGFLETKGF